MGEVIRFPTRLRPITADQAKVRDALIVTMAEGLCPSCFGRGFRVRLINPPGFFASDWEQIPCPCGGDDENRINPDEPDYPGAA